MISNILNSHMIMIVFVAVIAIIGIVSVKFMGDSNPIEKIAEQVIKEETGVSVNLTPNDTTLVSPQTTFVPSPASNIAPTETTGTQAGSQTQSNTASPISP